MCFIKIGRKSIYQVLGQKAFNERTYTCALESCGQTIEKNTEHIGICGKKYHKDCFLLSRKK